ncbi:MAG: VC0807 family protein [Actinocatenispora sp.]
MNDTAERVPVTPEQRRAGRRALVRDNLATVLLDLALPLATYYALRAAGVSQWWALMVSILVAVPHAVHQLVRRRRLDVVALFTISVIVFGVVVGLLTGSPRALAVREGWAHALLGLFGAWMLVTVLRGRPALLVLGRTIAVTKTGEAGARAWEDRWNHDQAFRRGMRVLTAVWGAVLLLDSAVSVALSYLLPIDLIALVANVQWYVVLAGVIAFHVYYTKKVDLRA